MTYNEELKVKLEEKTVCLVCDLKQLFDNVDSETTDSIRYMIYSALVSIADEAVRLARPKGNI